MEPVPVRLGGPGGRNRGVWDLGATVRDRGARNQRHPGQDPADAKRMVEIANASKPLMEAPNNALYMMIEKGASEDEAAGYIQRYGLGTEKIAASMASFLVEMRAYAYTYSDGGKLLDALFKARGDAQHWFKRLLTEPVTPGQIRAWTRGE